MRNISVFLLVIVSFWGCATQPDVGESVVTSIMPVEPEATSDSPEFAANLRQIKNMDNRMDSFNLVTESNLFSSDRSFSDSGSTGEKNTEPTPAPKQPAVELDSLKLVGTISTDQLETYAFIINKKDAEKKGKVQRVGLGEKIGEYVLEEIQKDRVRLRNGENVSIILLKPSERTQTAGKGSGGGAAQPKDSNKKQTGSNPKPAFERARGPVNPPSRSNPPDQEKQQAQPDRTATRNMDEAKQETRGLDTEGMTKAAGDSVDESTCGNANNAADTHAAGSSACGR